MLVKKKIEMWEATQTENGTWRLQDWDGVEREISDAEFHALYEEVPERFVSRRQQDTPQSIQEVLANDGKVQGDQESEESS